MDKIFLFDLGGVLIKPMDHHKLYDKLNCKISYSEFEKYWCWDKTVLDAHKGIITDDYHVKELLNYVKSDISLKEFYKIYAELRNQFYINTIEIIKKLKEQNYKVGLLSNLRLMDYNNCKDEIDNLMFDYLFLSYEIGYLKPYKEMYNYVIKECKCNPSDIIFFDDFIDNVNGAKDCGIDSYLVTGDNIKDVFYEIMNDLKEN